MAEPARKLSADLSQLSARAKEGVDAATAKASTVISKVYRGHRTRMSVASLVVQAKTANKAKESFRQLTRPRRPPFPGTATPPGYVIHNRRAPADATGPEKLRDLLLWLGTHRWVAVLQLIWLIALVVVFVIFVGCLLYWFGWGTETVEDWGCTQNTTCCTCDPPALTFKVEDYWQERMTQGMSALFTYSVLLATPWRISILAQCFSERCKGKVGVNFYGLPNEMPFFHIPRKARLAIAIILNINTLCQLVHQVTHIVWDDVVMYFEQPEGLISVMTGPIAGCITGAPAAVIQIYYEDALHTREPTRFPPGPLQALRKACAKPPPEAPPSQQSRTADAKDGAVAVEVRA